MRQLVAIDLADINLLRVLIETGSIAGASQKLSQSQPTLSRKLSRIEDRFKVKLFYRTPKGLIATELATYIVTKADPIDAQISEIVRHVEMVSQLDTGKLRIGVGPIIEQILLPNVLETFVASTGKSMLSITTDDEANLLGLFEASKLDLIVGPFRADDQTLEGLKIVPMVQDDIIAVATPQHPIFNE